ncbi:MAG TPA: pirin family protein [Bryobacteraceae bacterium]|nr:pirin family protein [Bryobacteraceae bacterium]
MAYRKIVTGVFPYGSQHWVGDGFPVRNVFPSSGVVDQVNPFLMLDYAGPTEFAPSDKPRGVGQHPHRGFETVSISYQGAVAHRDSSGNSGTIGPGDVQWMTAASGLVHEEMHAPDFTRKGGTFEGVQLWVNLPKAHKMSAPKYQALASDQIPTVNLGDGASARVIAGELGGVSGPAKTFTPIGVFDVRLTAGSRAELTLPENHNTAVVLLRGELLINSSESVKGEAQLAVLSPTGNSVLLEGIRESLVLVLTGEPIDEPVVSYGPFVMNTQDEIRQALNDYRAGKMGHLEEVSLGAR